MPVQLAVKASIWYNDGSKRQNVPNGANFKAHIHGGHLGSHGHNSNYRHIRVSNFLGIRIADAYYSADVPIHPFGACCGSN